MRRGTRGPLGGGRPAGQMRGRAPGCLFAVHVAYNLRRQGIRTGGYEWANPISTTRKIRAVRNPDGLVVEGCLRSANERRPRLPPAWSARIKVARPCLPTGRVSRPAERTQLESYRAARTTRTLAGTRGRPVWGDACDPGPGWDSGLRKLPTAPGSGPGAPCTRTSRRRPGSPPSRRPRPRTGSARPASRTSRQ